VNAAALAAKRRSQAALEMGRATEAVKLAKEAVAAAPDDAMTYCQLANACIAAGDYPASLDAADKATSLGPDVEWAHALRAVALLNLGKAREALEAVDEALRLNPNLGPRHRLRASCLAKLERPKEAEDAAERACQLSPEDPMAYAVLGDLAFAAHRWADAESAWRTALGLDPTNAPRLNNYGAALSRQGRKREALDAYRRAIRMDPSLDLAKRNLHHSVRGTLGRGALVAGAGALWVLKIAGVTAANGSMRFIMQSPGSGWRDVLAGAGSLVLLGAVIALARRGWIAYRARERLKDLEVRDPDLVRLYRQIDRDLAAGRIRRG